MGSGSYSISDRASSVRYAAYTTSSPTEIFKERSVNNAMNPNGVSIRESRDSAEHPESLAIIIALDVTGSMGSIPHFLIRDGLPEIMDGIIKKGILHPQVLFLGIGDDTCDQAPLQVGQFESSDELLDHWLETIWLEGRGGGNDGESYMLAWYFAAKHTSIDCWEKRKQKGFLFTIGDEPCLRNISQKSIKSIMGTGQYENFESVTLLDAAREKYDVYHIHMRQGSNGRRQNVIDGWTQLVGKDNLLIAERQEHVSKIITDVIVSNNKKNVPISDNAEFKQPDIIL